MSVDVCAGGPRSLDVERICCKWCSVCIVDMVSDYQAVRAELYSNEVGTQVGIISIRNEAAYCPVFYSI